MRGCLPKASGCMALGLGRCRTIMTGTCHISTPVCFALHSLGCLRQTGTKCACTAVATTSRILPTFPKASTHIASSSTGSGSARVTSHPSKWTMANCTQYFCRLPSTCLLSFAPLRWHGLQLRCHRHPAPLLFYRISRLHTPCSCFTVHRYNLVDLTTFVSLEEEYQATINNEQEEEQYTAIIPTFEEGFMYRCAGRVCPAWVFVCTSPR